MSIEEISVDDLADRLAEGARLIDVREPAEFEQARVAGARLIPLGTVADEVAAFTGEGPTYVICRSGQRSGRVCEFVGRHGVRAVNVTGGLLAWVESGRPVESGPVPVAE